MKDVKDSIGKVAVLGSTGLKVPRRKLPVRIVYIVAILSEWWIKMPWVPKSSTPTITKPGISSISKDLWFAGKRAMEELHNRPIFTLEEAIAQTAQWIRAEYLSSNSPTN